MLLSVKNLRVSFPVRDARGKKARLQAVDGASFEIGEGDTLGLVGESGCGKTTVSRAIVGLQPVDSGDIIFQGQSLVQGRGPRARELRRKIQMVFQDPFASLNPRMTVLDIVTEAAVAHGLVRRESREAAARELLEAVGMPADILLRYPHAFSGGQRQRLCIARALSLQPELLVCDEPVSALDVSMQAQVLNLLMELRESRKLAMLFISHNISVVQHISDRIAVMERGRIIEMGAADEVMSRPRHPYTKKLLAATLL